MRLSPTNQGAPRAAGRPKTKAETAAKTTTRRRAGWSPAPRHPARGSAGVTRPPSAEEPAVSVARATRSAERRGRTAKRRRRRPLLRLARCPRVPDGGALVETPAAFGHADDELRRLVLVLLEGDVAQDVDVEGPKTVGGVGQVETGQGVDDRREEDHAGPADPVAGVVGAQAAAGDDEVGVTGQDGGQQVGNLRRIVLTVGVDGDDVGGAQGVGQFVAQAERHPLPMLTGRTAQWAPNSATMSSVPSSPPSTATNVVTVWPSISVGTAFKTAPMLSASMRRR